MPRLGSGGSSKGPTLLLKRARTPLPSSLLRHSASQLCPPPDALGRWSRRGWCRRLPWRCSAAPQWLLVHLQATDTPFLFFKDNSHFY